MSDNEIHVAAEVTVYLETALTAEISRWGANLDSKLDAKDRLVPGWPARCSVNCVYQEFWVSEIAIKGTCDNISYNYCSLDRRVEKFNPPQKKIIITNNFISEYTEQPKRRILKQNGQ